MTSRHVHAQTSPSETARAAPEVVDAARPQHRRARASRRVTIAQIAAESGLSTATVSKVLNGKPDVSPSTRTAVQDVLISSGYRKRGSGDVPPLIDVVFSDFDSPWAIEIVRGAAAAAQARGLTVAFTALSEGDERRVWFDHITSRGTRGIILLLSQLTERQTGELVARGLPFVVIDPTAEPGPEVSWVGATNWSGGLAATKHLVDLGHERIGIITGPPELLCSRARLDGYRAALETAGLSVDDQLVRLGDFRVKAGYQQARIMFALPERPTAIFAGNDLSALGVLRAARESGLRVPEDLSVVGFDDIPLAEWSTPALTTVRQPLTEMAAVAVQTLLAGTEGGVSIRRRVELATDLIVRESTAPPSRDHPVVRAPLSDLEPRR
jgi:DNA-binding LacI/PurR family transcriptional regulator